MITILAAPLSIAGIASLMALLIMIVDKIANNYGEVEIDINEGKKKLVVRGGASLLVSLSAEGLYLPSACGGRGSCGACKCKVLNDVGPQLPTELPYLSEEEKQNNTRLACQLKLKKNIAIQIPEQLFNIKEYKAEVASIHDVTYDIKEVLLDLGEEEIDFKAGRYVQLVIPPYDKIKGETQRAYSMSSRPSDKHHVELLIRLVPGGIASTYVHTKLQTGQKISLIGPFGDFERTQGDSIMLLVAGGSGMAPFKSMLHDMLEKEEFDREVWYFFGARSLRDMFYLEEMRNLEKKMPNFHFVPALSEPQDDDHWDGPTGLITDVLDSYIKDKINKNGHQMEGFLCGSPGMIKACVSVMNNNSIDQDHIYYDSFA